MKETPLPLMVLAIMIVGFPLMVAMGCIYCRQCYLGKCPKGIASQTPALRRNLNVEKASQNVYNYLKSCNEEIKMAAAAIGKDNIHELQKSDLRSLDETVTKMTGIKLAGT